MMTGFTIQGLCDGLSEIYLQDENVAINHLLSKLTLTPADRDKIQEKAIALTTNARHLKAKGGFVQHIMERYPLETPEGVRMMCLAESFLRTPDDATKTILIQDKLSEGDFGNTVDRKTPVWMRGLSGGMRLFSKIIGGESKTLISRGALKMATPVVGRLMKAMADHFVYAVDAERALAHLAQATSTQYSYSFDMLGEGALTMDDADRHLMAYRRGIDAIGAFHKNQENPKNHPTLSIKLSAIYPRYEPSQEDRVQSELGERLKDLVNYARTHNVPITIDAEESNRLELSLRLIDYVLQDSKIASWGGLGLAVQAYQKRGAAVIDGLAAMAAHYQTRLNVRLVKGAYWDTEIKLAQEKGLDNYPVFTRKEATDLSYLVCAEKLFKASPNLYPQFATHNAMTLCAVAHMAAGRDYECQKLHGMGDTVYQAALAAKEIPHCRIYAPVGAHGDLLPYLVRRLLENGANTSFIRHMADDTVPAQDICVDPVTKLNILASESGGDYTHPKIPLPRHLYGSGRPGSISLNLDNAPDWGRIGRAIDAVKSQTARPWIQGKQGTGAERALYAPYDRETKIGLVEESTPDDARLAFDDLYAYSAKWRETTPGQRAAILTKTADLMERDLTSLIALLIHEGGKTAPDALNEVREAVDFCRYYALMGGQLCQQPQSLPGPTGETNQLFLTGRGVFLCISPWNFPLAIFMGQITAALITGNTVLAKPARQTPLIAHKAIQLLREAGLPPRAIAFLPGPGAALTNSILKDHRLGGVCFTGSTQTAWSIQKILGDRRGPIIPFIAETGGQNAMVVDSSALPEQVVRDVIESAFHCAGQRCSALRVLCLQEDIAPAVITMLTGAMGQLIVGRPTCRKTDIGPVIDGDAAAELTRYRQAWMDKGRVIAETPLDTALKDHGFFVPPSIIELEHISELEDEVFGPILHVVRFNQGDFMSVLNAINDLGYGLTFGLHSRIDGHIDVVRKTVRAGNIYVGRPMTGAVVGVQPFGGNGLSGTGPKAGGPHYLGRFMMEQTLTVNTAAQGGNANLMTLTS